MLITLTNIHLVEVISQLYSVKLDLMFPENVAFVLQTEYIHIDTYVIWEQLKSVYSTLQIDEYASNNGMTIVGYYVAPENIRESNFEKLHHRLADKIVSNNGSAYIVIVSE